MRKLRPWGPLGWLLSRLGKDGWSLLGTASTEDRCTATIREIKLEAAQTRFLAIHDPDPRDRTAFLARIEGRKNELVRMGVPLASLTDVDLLANLDSICEQVNAFLSVGTAKVLLDISSMPKRWFFPIVQELMSDSRVQVLVACYAVPEKYGDSLAENPDLIRMLPGFPGNGGTEYDTAIIGIGFEPLGIASLFTDLKLGKTRLLFPFPPGPPGFRRNWMFVKFIEEMRENREIDPPDRVHIHTQDCPQVFDAICTMTEQGLHTAVLAPYGPKPMSLAMCLYSLAASKAGKAAVPVYYAQPRRYALDYSTGIRYDSSGADIQAYCLKLSGRDLYMI